MEQKALRKKFEQEKLSYQELIEKIDQTRLTFSRKAGEKDVIFGSVSTADIKEALSQLGIEVDKKKILLDEPIKRLGNYAVPIKVFHDERAEVKIEVIQEGKEERKEAVEEKKQEVVKKTTEEDKTKEKSREKSE